MDTRTYTWLYRNDRAWLDAHKPAPLPQRSRSLPVDWAARDERLSGLVREAALRLMEERGVRRINFGSCASKYLISEQSRLLCTGCPAPLRPSRRQMTAHVPSQDLLR